MMQQSLGGAQLMMRALSLQAIFFWQLLWTYSARVGLPSFPPKLGFLRLGSWLRLTRSMTADRFPSSTAAAEMEKSPAGKVDGAGEESKPSRDPSLNPVVARLRQLMINGATDIWEKCWEEGLTPWDLGQATPIITHLVQSGKLPEGRILVPGCGTGYDVAAMASHERYVVGLDISSTAVNKAKKWSSSLPNAKYFTFLAEDFFTWTPTELFDVIFDYTFFCAIHPTMRPAWAMKVNELLKPDGELIALMYLFDNQEAGPPYNTSVEDYVEVLNPVGLTAISIVDNELAVKPRKGAEKIGRWKKGLNLSSL